MVDSTQIPDEDSQSSWERSVSNPSPLHHPQFWYWQSWASIKYSGNVYKLTKGEKYQVISLGDNNYYDILNKTTNDFLRPQAGITKLTSSTMGNLGLLKKTEVSFKVYNFIEYQEIYQRYFFYLELSI